jgi:tRNA 2-selenouridine synthase
VLAKVGWKSGQLDGGYRAYRRTVLAELETLPGMFDFIAVCGATGTGKSRFLAALEKSGAQVLDLEGLARHRGSVLGSLPGEPQPSQKYFESLVWSVLRHLDPSRPVHVEAESKKIGNVRVPDALLARMWEGDCLVLDASLEARIRLLKEEYWHFLDDPEAICEKLAFLAGIHGHEKVSAWQAQARAGEWDPLVGELLEKHYDPAYRRATLKHYPRLPAARHISPGDLSETGMIRAVNAYLDGA